MHLASAREVPADLLRDFDYWSEKYAAASSPRKLQVRRNRRNPEPRTRRTENPENPWNPRNPENPDPCRYRTISASAAASRFASTLLTARRASKRSSTVLSVTRTTKSSIPPSAYVTVTVIGTS